MIVQPHLTSPLVWDMAVLSVYLAIGIVDLWILDPGTGAARRRCGSWRSSACRWRSSCTPSPRGSSGCSSPAVLEHAAARAAVHLVGARVGNRARRRDRLRRRASHDFRVGAEVYAGLRRLLLWFVAADAFLLFTEVMTTYVSGDPDHREQLDILLTGRLAPVFWSEVILGSLLPAAPARDAGSAVDRDADRSPRRCSCCSVCSRSGSTSSSPPSSSRSSVSNPASPADAPGRRSDPTRSTSRVGSRPACCSAWRRSSSPSSP